MVIFLSFFKYFFLLLIKMSQLFPYFSMLLKSLLNPGLYFVQVQRVKRKSGLLESILGLTLAT